ncbi:MAG: hypothetical protein ACK493_02135 [Planctomycetota bacterium]|jgi:hypothetical protein|nr:hypothetical protein [Blastopirellula sp.]
MSSPRRPALPWNKLLAIALLLLLVGYIFARPTLERWWGVQLPSLIETGEAPSPAPEGKSGTGSEPNREWAGRDSESSVPPSDLVKPGSALPGAASNDAASRAAASRDAASRDLDSSVAGNERTDEGGNAKDPFRVPPRTSKKENVGAEKGAKWELKSIDRGRLLSPAGLIYARGPQGEHRVDHVMRHAEDDPNRPQHGVFNGSREEILQLLDEAYQLIQQKSKRVNQQAEGDRTEYTIRFDRPIGYEGGRIGKRNNFPQVNRLRLVLEEGKSVITAYPVR